MYTVVIETKNEVRERLFRDRFEAENFIDYTCSFRRNVLACELWYNGVCEYRW